ncbi:hypothetical protein EBI_27121 [Enterocytozoon bieneusi H348]|nr:hypothetical protein EBI_27121 [Enterocytozoon bieneusi H348]|eukprot:XP_002650806.1 hypothetical protein EBI_27121 [Enterocytozoon bieneusi H348]
MINATFDFKGIGNCSFSLGLPVLTFPTSLIFKKRLFPPGTLLISPPPFGPPTLFFFCPKNPPIFFSPFPPGVFF